MSHGKLTKGVAALLIPFMLCFLVLPSPAAAQDEDPCTKGKKDAQRNTSGMWFFAGCLGLVGVLIAYLVEPSPPVSETMGKDPTWVAQYTDCYKSAGKSSQGKRALGGCCVLAAAEIILWVVLLSSVDDE